MDIHVYSREISLLHLEHCKQGQSLVGVETHTNTDMCDLIVGESLNH
jgi:hypothetical protein